MKLIINYNVNSISLIFQNFKFPDHAGMPVGTSDSMKYLILETHFDNPQKSDSKCTNPLPDTVTLIILPFNARDIFKSTAHN